LFTAGQHAGSAVEPNPHLGDDLEYSIDCPAIAMTGQAEVIDGSEVGE
jgi:hypothetical protein